MTTRAISILVLSVVLAALTGCASTTRKVERDTPVSAAALAEARSLMDSTRETNALLYRLSVAAADQCTASDAPHRAPFSLLFNGANVPSEELRTAVYRVSGVAELPVVQAHLPVLRTYDGARIVSVNKQSTSNLNKVYTALHDASVDNRTLELTLDDGRTVTAAPVAGCSSMVLTDYSGLLKEPFNTFGGTEVTPKSWLQVTRNEDERAFVLARSIYFTAADGDAKLRHAFYGGSVVSGVFRGLTFGLGPLIVDPKTVAVRMRRRSNKEEADAFALVAMRRAGFDPQAAHAFAQRSIDEGKSWPGDTDELKFDAPRLAALKRALQ